MIMLLLTVIHNEIAHSIFNQIVWDYNETFQISYLNIKNFNINDKDKKNY